MQFATVSVILAAASGAVAATCNAVLTSALSGTTCPISQISSDVWYEKKADCGSAATVTFEDARGGSNPVTASIAIENTSSGTTRISWSQVNYANTNYYYVDLAAGASCDKTFATGDNVGSVTYA